MPVFISRNGCKSIRYFGESRVNDHLYIRFHPRLAADKRGLPASSSFTKQYKTFLLIKDKYKNITFIQPDSELSSFRLGLSTEVTLTGFSSIGYELAAMNKPVVPSFINTIYGASALFPLYDSIDPFRSPEDYFVYLDQILDAKGSLNYSNTSHIIKKENAIKAIFINKLLGAVDLDKETELLDQIKNPTLLTPFFSEAQS